MTMNTQQEHTLPKDTNAALSQVIGTIKSMNDLYTKETKALHATDTEGFLSLQDQKVKIAREYQNTMTQMMARKGELTTANPAMKDKLKMMYAEFESIAKENVEAIERMQRCTEKLGNTIRNAAIRAARSQQTFSYGENGSLSNTTQKRGVSSGLSETV